MRLTRRQQQVYDFLKSVIHSRGYGPTVREIGAHFGISSPNGVICHLNALEKKGLIKRESNTSRAIQLAGQAAAEKCLPLLGTTTDTGCLLRTDETNDSRSVAFRDLFDNHNRTCLRVSGPAFQVLGISDGDFVILSHGKTDSDGDLVVATDHENRIAFCLLKPPGQ
ncbi:MAG: hypothetical protein KDA89_18370, partial [Planctomycetaceae bacterium]|nr:hypothetical protein [Planctomycetaceae bacterium]